MPQACHLAVDIPTLETARLRLRAHRFEDFPECVRMWSDPNVTRNIRPTPFSEEETWSRLLRYIGHWTLLGFGYWVILQKETGTFLGEVGFADYKRNITPSLEGMPEIGWALAAHAHGKGFATEAVRAVITWGDAHFGPKRTACIIAPENLASIRVAEKCGYREFQRTTYHGSPTLMYVRDPL
ncbi:MAG TPA: GNAT family N-acetyltransferase [Candidatus Eisenbacteria bacterium]|nr:GNAT family N-acetyltransferase [Candidatus Eisenbacteria bacterium]